MSHQTSKKEFCIQLRGEQTELRLLGFVCWPCPGIRAACGADQPKLVEPKSDIFIDFFNFRQVKDLEFFIIKNHRLANLCIVYIVNLW